MKKENKNIYVTSSSMPPYEEYIKEIKDIWETHILTNMGEKHNELQQKLENYLNCKHISLFVNGHLALENTLEAMSFKPGSEIITTPFTFASTTHAIVRKGCVPVFCDINNDDYTIDVNKIESLITKKTVAILPVHVYGNICDVEGIDNIAKKYGLKVIYDAAHAFGETYKGESVANFGDVSMFSFHATKVFNTIEGGAACYHADELVQKFDDLKNFGIHDAESVYYVGGNAKMNEFQACMGICNLRYVDECIRRRKILAERYRNNLMKVNGIKLSKEKSEIKYNYSYFPILFDNYKYTRNQIYSKLLENKIYSRKYFYPLVSDFECYKEIKHGDMPIAKHISNNVLTLPLYPELDISSVDSICDIIANC